MSNQEAVSLQFAIEQLEHAEREMSEGALLDARERLALVVAALDRVCYPGE